MTIRVALEIFANHLVSDNDFPDENTDIELNNNYLNRIKDIREAMFLKQCSKCPDSDHEGIFCRCEDRNIKVAKIMRDQGKSPWNKEKDV